MVRRKTKKIHVNQHIIRANRTNGENQPVLTVKAGSQNFYGHEVKILDANGKTVATVVYRPLDPLNCGATVWIETDADVQVVKHDITML